MKQQPPSGQYQYGQPGYGQPQGNWQPSQMAQNQPAIQAGRAYARNDRLPPMPEMLQPARPSNQTIPQQPVVRGAAPEQQPVQQQPPQYTINPSASSPGWRPVRIPTPDELGIAPVNARPAPLTAIDLPDRYDLGTVTAWLDRQGARSCQREKLAEGVQYLCSWGQSTNTITVRGTSDDDALRKLVQEVVRQKQLTLSQR